MDTIKRVQDLMQARDMNLCVLAKKCGISYSTIQTTARRGGQLSVETTAAPPLFPLSRGAVPHERYLRYPKDR